MQRGGRGDSSAKRPSRKSGVTLTTLFEAPQAVEQELPKPLLSAYDGNLALAEDAVYANFVTTLDGVVALGDGAPPSVISGSSPADRLVMGLLRALASAVIIGAATLRAEPEHLWTPDHIHPPLASAYRALRTSLELPPTPNLVILTRSGDVDGSAVALEQGALIVTTTSGAARLRGRVPGATSIRTVMSGQVDPAEVVSLLRRDGHRSILTEGGPRVFGSFLRSGAVDELFLTLSPRLAGRSKAVPRLGLVEGMALGPDELLAARLLSVKQHGSHLFLRYRLGEG